MDGEGAMDPAGEGFVVEDWIESAIPAKFRESKSAPSASTSMEMRPLKPSSVGNALARHSSGAVFVY